ncbi:hypothetical protein CDG81_17095 [Actinopolyspora erythraea]|uniref:Uncharacterized protein n=1 Tax=Actinopolyspora erythraea TaxID=414996 RepID=A0A099D110_9ACTN|nr:hypothetical protein [Actinopolyspora erythraea]ASU79700.1 hypothetical protein CDG81_17095 [Actinopolyspora erythraea]KGI79487.1 hypothetical protein IL38_23005 [Actinopolyspora erythraea]
MKRSRPVFAPGPEGEPLWQQHGILVEVITALLELPSSVIPLAQARVRSMRDARSGDRVAVWGGSGVVAVRSGSRTPPSRPGEAQRPAGQRVRAELGQHCAGK